MNGYSQNGDLFIPKTYENDTIYQHAESFKVEDIMTVFDDCFYRSYNTRLLSGGSEPLYLPAGLSCGELSKKPYHAIYFAHGFFSSALHESAHWFIAGAQRRKREDFGYWYTPDGRTATQQALFERVEIKPQALEWIFCVTVGYRFRLSTDNLTGENTDSSCFKNAVYIQVKKYLKEGLPKRAEIFRTSLSHFYNKRRQSSHHKTPLHIDYFNLDGL